MAMNDLLMKNIKTAKEVPFSEAQVIDMYNYSQSKLYREICDYTEGVVQHRGYSFRKALKISLRKYQHIFNDYAVEDINTDVSDDSETDNDDVDDEQSQNLESEDEQMENQHLSNEDNLA